MKHLHVRHIVEVKLSYKFLNYLHVKLCISFRLNRHSQVVVICFEQVVLEEQYFRMLSRHRSPSSEHSYLGVFVS